MTPRSKPAPTREELTRELEAARKRIAEIEALLIADGSPPPTASSDPASPTLPYVPSLHEGEFTRILLDTLDEGVVVCDAGGRLILFNRTAREWHGMDAAPLGQEDWAVRYGLFEPDGVTPMPTESIALAQALKGSHVRDVPMVIRAEGQPPRQVITNAAPFYGADGLLMGAVTVLHDVTRRMATEKDLELSRAQLAMAMDMAKLVRWERDLATDVYTFNDQFYALYGTTAEREGGMEMTWDKYLREFVHPGDNPKVTSVIKDQPSGEIPATAQADHRIIRRDGAVRHITVRYITIKDENGRPVKRIGANQDITDRKEIERALEIRTAQLAMAMDMARLARWEGDPQAGFLMLNDQFFALYGTTAEREGGYRMTYEKYVREFFRPEDVHLFEEATRTLMEDENTEAIHTVVHRIIRRDGEVRHIRVRFRNLTVDGQPRVVGTNQDITEQKQAEERLLRITARLEEAQRIAQVGDWDLDPATGENHWSEQLYHIAGLDPSQPAPGWEELGGLLHPDDWRMYKGAVSHALETGEPYECELRHPRRDGSTAYILAKGIPELDDSGKVIRLHGTVQDITEAKLAEMALIESRAKLARFTGHVEESLRKTRTVLHHILESMPSAIIAVDTKGVVTHWNRFARELSGRCAAEALGTRLESAFPWLAGQVPNVELSMKSGLTSSHGKIPFEAQGGTSLMDITIYPFGSDGVEGAVLRLDDVTGRVRLEEMMVQTEKMITVGSMAGGMAHEINNPLSGILQSTQIILRRLAQDSPANQKAAERAGCSLEAVLGFLEDREILSFLQAIDHSGKRASAIVKNMLGFIRKSPAAKTPNSLCDLVERALELASTDYDLKKQYDFRHIAVTRDYQQDMPNVPCASMEIEQVVFNLLTNAAQAMKKRKDAKSAPEIVLRVRKEGSQAIIQVQDNGPGMDAATRKKIFEPFFTTKELGMGTGLGLSVAYFIMTRNHGGSISVDSEPGKGTVFTLTLPLLDGRSETPACHGAS